VASQPASRPASQPASQRLASSSPRPCGRLASTQELPAGCAPRLRPSCCCSSLGVWRQLIHLASQFQISRYRPISNFKIPLNFKFQNTTQFQNLKYRQAGQARRRSCCKHRHGESTRLSGRAMAKRSSGNIWTSARKASSRRLHFGSTSLALPASPSWLVGSSGAVISQVAPPRGMWNE